MKTWGQKLILIQRVRVSFIHACLGLIVQCVEEGGLSVKHYSSQTHTVSTFDNLMGQMRYI